MLVLALSVLAASPLPPGAAAASKSITAEAIRGPMKLLASDEFEGRGPGTRGDALTQRYLASEFEALGLKPFAPGGQWVQPVELLGVTSRADRLVASAGKQSATLMPVDDFIAVSGHFDPVSRLDKAELVFVGYGIVAPEFGWDDFKGVDLAGKVLLVMNNDPEDDPTIFGGRARLWYGRWDYKYEQARRLGAAGCVVIHTTPSAGYPWQVVQTSWSGEQFELPGAEGPRLQVKGWTTEDATRRLVALGGKDLDALRAAANRRDFQPVPLGVSVSLTLKNTVQRKTTGNVLGLLEGSDPVLAGEVVVYTAHHDHLGVKADAKPGEDAIFNGAVDNAGGVATMLAIAKAFTQLPKAPRRSILFVALAAEEQGLLGSRYLMEHPPVPASYMAANINVDGINIWGRTRDVSVIGLGKSSLDAIIIDLARAQGRTVKPDALADRGFFYRSDQLNFAKAGVPAAYFSSGHDFIGRPEGWGREQSEAWERAHYHRPSDEVSDAWDLSGAVEDGRLYFQLGAVVANAPQLPTWNKGDEFEATRLRSLQARGSR
ncbi:MAG: M20/M25/M40 family metallo-hydrolase [Myxococcota bacterium]